MLLKKGANQSLGHFYILEIAETESIAAKALLKFTHDFVREYYQTIENSKQSMVHLMDHPDVIVLGNTEQKEDEKAPANYTVLDAERLSRFFEFKAVQAKRKFAVITEAHKITNVVANKLLKLFEEPQGITTIFLLNPRRTKLLDTIHSRAIHIRLPTQNKTHDQTEWNNFLSDVRGQTLSKFLETFSKSEPDLSFWMSELIQWESEQSDQSQGKTALENWIQLYQEMELFHQPTATKWTLFYNHLQLHVLPRHLL